ncbi:MAG TPA: SET domain-containing protein [Pseudolabrys sp.]|jgi:SET domain-containing protein|nr:SET domain-containing protein [Pseudolabrys sp.]
MSGRKPYRVGRSATGLGLFAIETIDKDADIVAYTGRRIRTALAREIDRRRGNKYLFEIDERWTIDGSTRKNMARYVNHACQPNAEAVLTGGRMVYRATEIIPAGAEITVDYGDEYVELYFKDGCRCAGCRD